MRAELAVELVKVGERPLIGEDAFLFGTLSMKSPTNEILKAQFTYRGSVAGIRNL